MMAATVRSGRTFNRCRSSHGKRKYMPDMRMVQLLLLLLLILMTKIGAAEGTDDSDDVTTTSTNSSPEETPQFEDTATTTARGESNKKIISLAESIQKSQLDQLNSDRANLMKEYWKKTLKEIKDLEIARGDARPPLLTQWKAFIDDDDDDESVATADEEMFATNTSSSASTATTNATTNTSSTSSTMTNRLVTRVTSAYSKQRRPSRFEGFRSWDRLLQEWNDDVAEYLKKRVDSKSTYPMSTYGRINTDDTTSSKESDGDEDDGADYEYGVTANDDDNNSDNQEDALVVLNPTTIAWPTPRTIQPGEAIVPSTDLSDKSKSIWIVTTASLPWMTGTAVNPLLRAAYLTKGRQKAGGKITLMLPWLEDSKDQERIYSGRVFESKSDQEEYIRSWLKDSANLEQASQELNIAWYMARVEQLENSIYSMGDITALIPSDVDICILEEPEHLNWYRAPGEGWTTKFKHVVGIIHTNYFVYAQEQPAAFVRAPSMRLLCSWMCRAHCHRVIKLSGTLGKFAPEKELVENVHGVRPTFLDIGEEVRKILTRKTLAVSDTGVFAADSDPTVYFIGKMLWSKGLGSMMELLKYAEESAGLRIHVDMYGGGPDKDNAATKSKRLGLDMEYHGPLDHSKLALSHKVFVNPSTSEVLCTTTAEALAMGKFVVLPSHPSNDFFAQFPNCLPYTNKEEFVGNLYYALTHSPEPLSDEYAYALSWDAANERLEAAGSISVEEHELVSAALSSQTAGVEIDLPPIIENDKQRKRIASTIRLSRNRYRLFRQRLSEEIQQSKVLPKEVQKSLTQALDKRLDLDIETIMNSPKLRFQLSPAELDKRLLEFYNDVTKGVMGDVLRVIAGGNNVGRQNLYLKRQAQKTRRRRIRGYDSLSTEDPVLPLFTESQGTAEKDRTPTERVTDVLRRNLPSRNSVSLKKQQHAKQTKSAAESTKMSLTKYVAVAARPPKSRSFMGSPLI